MAAVCQIVSMTEMPKTALKDVVDLLLRQGVSKHPNLIITSTYVSVLQLHHAHLTDSHADDVVYQLSGAFSAFKKRVQQTPSLPPSRVDSAPNAED